MSKAQDDALPQALAASSHDGGGLERLVRTFAGDGHVHETLSGGGVLHLDRFLPFLLVHRARAADPGTPALVAGESCYLIVGSSEAAEAQARALIDALAAAAVQRFGAYLVIELWSEDARPPAFRIIGPLREASSTMQALAAGLSALALPTPAAVLLEYDTQRQTPGHEPLLGVSDAWRRGCLLLGLGVPALYRDDRGDVFPVFLRRFAAALSRVLRQTVHDFVRVQTTAGVESYRALGPRRVDRLVWRADEELAAIEQRFDFLMLVAPMDADAAWDRFRRAGCARAPEFHYRLLPFDPDLLKRRLYAVELERVEDPALAQLLRDKRDELDRHISMLGMRGTPAFRLASQQLYGACDDALAAAARTLLAHPGDEARGDAPASPVSAEQFAAAAQLEVERYRAQLPGLRVDIQVRPDVTGLLVSSGRLFIGERLALPPRRVDALLQHEVGTHVVTFVNGAAQPLRQLQHGLAGYDELQEALGVLAEYLVGGLTRGRLATLGARVLAARSVEQGADFMETYTLLTREHGFAGAAAFDVTERVHHSGGFTRDLIYLRGLLWLLGYIARGCELESLYIGKLGQAHTELVGELREREVLVAPPLRPLFLARAEARARLARLAAGAGIDELLREAA